jgi:hypothetical protein
VLKKLNKIYLIFKTKTLFNWRHGTFLRLAVHRCLITSSLYYVSNAEGDTEGAQLLSQAFEKAGDGLIELRRIEAAEDIASQMSQSRNIVYLPPGQKTLLSLPQ